MARRRMIHPDFFTDADLLSLPPLHRLLFAGLWPWADREGRLRDKPLELKIKILPADNCDVNAMLDDLARLHFIVRYEVEGKRYLWVRTFKDHQSPHPNEAASSIPPPQGALGEQRCQPDEATKTKKENSANAVSVSVSGSSVSGSSYSGVAAPSALLRCMDLRAEKFPEAIAEPLHVLRPIWEDVMAEAAIAKRDVAIVEYAYRRYLEDPFWAKQPEPCPMGGFRKQWRKFAQMKPPAEPTHRILSFKPKTSEGAA